MEITEVRIKLVTNPNERLRAFCSVTLDGDFVIRDLKIIEGVNGAFVAMPSRKLADRCPRCGSKNHLRARFCNDCGVHLKENRAPKDGQGRAKLHADIAHPINPACRERIQQAVVDAYQKELERSRLPGYRPQSFDDFDEYEGDLPDTEEPTAEPASAAVSNRQPSAAPRDEFSDYNSLIDDLRRDAAGRQQSQAAKAAQEASFRLPSAEGENAIGKPAYVTKRSAEPREEPEPTRKPAGAGDDAAKPNRRPEPSQDQDDSFGAGLL